jgi:hypothetical protein
MKLWMGIAMGLMVGLGGGAVLALMFERRPATPKVAATPTDVGEGDDEEALAAANANLVATLQECNRRLADLGQKRMAPTPEPVVAARPESSAGRGPRGERRERTTADWDRWSKEGVVPYVPVARRRGLC